MGWRLYPNKGVRDGIFVGLNDVRIGGQLYNHFVVQYGLTVEPGAGNFVAHCVCYHLRRQISGPALTTEAMATFHPVHQLQCKQHKFHGRTGTKNSHRQIVNK